MSAPTVSTPPVPFRSLTPRLPGRIIIGVALTAIVVTRVLMRLEEPPRPFNDVALCNLVTMGLGFIILLTLWGWFSFRSTYPRLVRLLGLLSPIVPIVIFAPGVGVLRVEEVNGDMIPTRFAFRWTLRHDQALAQVETSPAAPAIDLKTTTPDDFPQFLGPARSAWLPGPKLAREWKSQPPKLLWKKPIGAGWSAFAAVNGYAGTQEQRGESEWVACYEIATGNPVWGHSIIARHENPLGGIGPRATPTIHQGRVYTLGATGMLHCLDGGTGRVIWQEDLLARFGGGMTQAEFEGLVQWGYSGSPLIVDNLVVVPGGGKTAEAKNLVAFQAETGKVVWEATCPRPLGGTEQIAYASPALATVAGVRQILIVNEGTASGHDAATGQCLWSHEWPGHSNTDASSSQAVAVGEDRVLLSKAYSGGAELLRLTPAADSKELTLESVWKNPRVLQTKFTNLVIYQDHAYGLSEGILECVSLADGQRRWKRTRGRYGNGQILGVGDLLLVISEQGRLALVELNPAEFKELDTIQALDGKSWNNLCLYGNRLLLRNSQEAACYELPLEARQ